MRGGRDGASVGIPDDLNQTGHCLGRHVRHSSQRIERSPTKQSVRVNDPEGLRQSPDKRLGQPPQIATPEMKIKPLHWRWPGLESAQDKRYLLSTGFLHRAMELLLCFRFSKIEMVSPVVQSLGFQPCFRTKGPPCKRHQCERQYSRKN